jgi:hypothetical protein
MSDEPPDKNQRRNNESQKPDRGKRPVRDTDVSWAVSSSRPTSRDERRPPRLPNSTHSISTIDEEPDEEPLHILRHKDWVHASTTDSRAVETRSPLERRVWWDHHTAWLLQRDVDPYPEPGASLEQATQTRNLPPEHTQYVAGLTAFSIKTPSSNSESASRVVALLPADNATGGSANILSGSTLYLSTGSAPSRDIPPVPVNQRAALSSAEDEQEDHLSNQQIEQVPEHDEQLEQQMAQQQAADVSSTPGDTDNPAVSDLQGNYFLLKEAELRADLRPQAMRDGSSVLAIVSCLPSLSRKILACVRRS